MQKSCGLMTSMTPRPGRFGANPVDPLAGGFDVSAALAGEEARHVRKAGLVADAPRTVVASILVGHSCPLVAPLESDRTGVRATSPQKSAGPAQSSSLSKSRPRGGLPSAALRRVYEAMEQRLDEKLELAELAAVAGISRSHFSRAFRESVGQSPHRYLMIRRVAAAEALIRDTDRRLTDISVEVGFFDQSHFVRVFTRIVGETPSAYRRRRQGTQ